MTTASDGKKYRTTYYNLDVIISVGYRVKSKRGTQFRQWALKVIKDYMLRGYAINQQMLAMEEHMDKRIGSIENTLAEHQENGMADVYRTNLRSQNATLSIEVSLKSQIVTSSHGDVAIFLMPLRKTELLCHSLPRSTLTWCCF